MLDPRKINSPVQSFLDSFKLDLGGTNSTNSGKFTKMSLANFKAQVTDFARPNRFMIEIVPPSILAADLGLPETEFVRMLAQTAVIPARNQGEITIKYHGMELKLPGDYSKENLLITFLNDYGFIGRFLFESWMEFGIQTIVDNNSRMHSSRTISDSSISVNQLGRVDDDILGTYKFYNVFPTSISSIELDMSSENQVEKFTVTFAYSHYENMGIYY